MKLHVMFGVSILLIVIGFGLLSMRIDTLEEEKAGLLQERKDDAALIEHEHAFFLKELEKAYNSQLTPQPCTLKVDKLNRVVCN